MLENEVTGYCYSKTKPIVESFSKTSILIGQNKLYLRSGEQLEISAGVGSYSQAANLKVQIDGKAIPLQDNILAICKYKIHEEPGKYFKRVKMDYVDQDNIPRSRTYKIDYIIEK